MQGSPILRAAIALAALLLLLVPLRSFTTARVEARMAAAAKTQDSPAHLEIVSTKTPFRFAISHLGKTIWQGEAPTGSASTDLPLPIPTEGIDLAVRLDWQSDDVAAAKLILSHGDADPVERTVWGNRHAEDVLTFP